MDQYLWHPDATFLKIARKGYCKGANGNCFSQLVQYIPQDRQVWCEEQCLTFPKCSGYSYRTNVTATQDACYLYGSTLGLQDRPAFKGGWSFTKALRTRAGTEPVSSANGDKQAVCYKKIAGVSAP